MIIILIIIIQPSFGNFYPSLQDWISSKQNLAPGSEELGKVDRFSYLSDSFPPDGRISDGMSSCILK